MVDTLSVTNSDTIEPARPALPAIIHLDAGEARRIPSPGTQRALKAETGRNWDELCGPNADSADRIQTVIWMKLRRQFPGLRWVDCDEVDVQVDEGDVDPTRLGGSANSPGSADSGI